jgi:cellulose 1,4-beta-cellobiosidase
MLTTQANSEGWTPNAGDANAGSGKYGACCHEMDLWEANSISAAYTPHVCSVDGPKRCSGTDCGDGDDRYKGLCDKDGCDFNSYRQGNRSFYGPGMKIDTKGKITVITQFVTNDGTDTGTLSEIRRKYVQNGVVIDNSVSTIPGVEGNSITDAYCSAQKTAFGDNNQFADLGGLKTMGAAIGRGMVLALSVWDDHSVNMLWLDSSYPPEKDPEAPGVARGSCSPDSGVPSKIEVDAADSQVIYSNIKFGAIGSTFKSGGAQPPVGSQPPVSSPTAKPTSSPTSKPTTSPTSKPTTSPTSKPTTSPTSKPTSAPTSTPTSSPGTGAALYAQCGGKNWQGPTTCTTGKCTVSNEYYSQCLP